MLRFRLMLVFCLFLGLAWALACNGPPPPSEKNPDGTTQPDGSDPEKDPPGDQPKQTWKPAGHAALAFSVDDTANKTYKEKQLLWNGSFQYEAKTNTVVYASAWQPTDGPFPPLYDDGPIDEGGHEPPGAKAGDHIWGIVVFVKPDAKEDLEFEYGVINEDNSWIWEGPNGMVTVKKGSTALVKAKGMKIPAHGNIDIKITLNAKELPPAFALSDPNTPIFLKGTMNNWFHVQILDKGIMGDEKADDGIYTYIQSKVLNQSPHFGLLQHERHVQFVFQFTSAQGREYKDADDKAIVKGVTAWADCNNDGKFSDDEKQTIVWEKDSRGAVQNTAIVVCKGKTPPCTQADCNTARCKDHPLCQASKCTKDSDCKADETCNTSTGKCEPRQKCTQADCHKPECQNDPICQCTKDDDCPSGETCNTSTGKCEPRQKCTKDEDCPSGETCEKATGRCITKPCTKADCGTDRCKNDPICKDPGKDPEIQFVIPNKGPLSGGLAVTIEGLRFQQGAKVKFGSSEATDVKVVSDKKITCKTPPANQKGTVDVTVINPDGRSGNFPQGFTYDTGTAPTNPTISSVSPKRGRTTGGTAVTIQGAHFKTGGRVTFGGKNATNVQVLSDSQITCKTPPHSKGTVDVAVINPNGSQGTASGAFEYYELDPNTFAIYEVDPPFGIEGGGNTVIVRGGGFASGVTVSFGGTAATQVTVTSKTELEVTTPKASSAGKVDVAVTLSGKTETLSQGFVYTGVGSQIGWCNLQWPKSIPDPKNSIPGVSAGQASPAIYGRIFKTGVTNKVGQGPGITAHLGYGPTGTDPSKDPGWVWFTAAYGSDKDGLGKNDNDEYVGKVTPAKAGTYDYAYRFSDDGVHFWYCDTGGNSPPNGAYVPAKAGKMTVQ